MMLVSNFGEEFLTVPFLHSFAGYMSFCALKRGKGRPSTLRQVLEGLPKGRKQTLDLQPKESPKEMAFNFLFPSKERTTLSTRPLSRLYFLKSL